MKRTNKISSRQVIVRFSDTQANQMITKNNNNDKKTLKEVAYEKNKKHRLQ